MKFEINHDSVYLHQTSMNSIGIYPIVRYVTFHLNFSLTNVDNLRLL